MPTQRETADAPIGIFDSGFGGLTVARSVIDQLPHESVVYLGDTARQPYGPKPIGEVREYALECLDHLVDQGVNAWWLLPLAVALLTGISVWRQTRPG